MRPGDLASILAGNPQLVYKGFVRHAFLGLHILLGYRCIRCGLVCICIELMGEIKVTRR